MRILVAAIVAAFLATLLGPAATAVDPTASTSVVAKPDCRRTRPAYPEIAPGTRSGAVRSFQCVLNDAGLGPVTIDGFYGPKTQAAVKKLTDGFECCIPHPLKVRTWYWTILFTASHPLKGLHQGDTGIKVKTLQRALRADGETLVVDGDFGPQTTTQVKVFQGECNITKTGRITDRTLFFLSQGGCNG